MAELPAYLTEQTEQAIRQRMLDALPADLDKSEGGFLWDAIAPAAIELAQAAIWAQQVLQRGFAGTTFGPYLDLRAEEHGLTRRPAVAARGSVTFTGAPGTVIPSGTRVSTSSSEVAAAVLFATTAAVSISESGTGTVGVEAVNPGAAGNVAAATVQHLVQPVPGVTGVTNPAPTAGGLDQETDAEFLARYLQKVRSPSAGGNKADYVNWTLEVAGVGGVAVVPVRDGPGTVSVTIIDTGKQPASQELVDAVQDYIAPPWHNEVKAETLTPGGAGVSLVADPDAGGGQAVQMAYDPAGEGTAIHPALHTLMQQPGIWQVRPRVKVDSTAGTTGLLRVGVWNVSAGGWARTRPGGSAEAVVTVPAANLAPGYADAAGRVEAYWNGQDQLELRISRLQTDTTTTLWVEKATCRSLFSRDTGDGKAPVGARVTVEPATAVVITVSATLTIAPGYNADSVRAAVQQAIGEYIKSLAFMADNDVRYVRVGQAILDTVGVQDYQDLLVNGGVANVTVGDQEVAVLGTVTLT